MPQTSGWEAGGDLTEQKLENEFFYLELQRLPDQATM